MNQIVIDGVEYVPRNSVVSDASMDALREAYSIAFCYGIYDPDTRPEYLRKVWDLLHIVNQELRFRA